MTDTVYVYSKNKCVQCTATTRFLDNLKVPYEYVNLDEQPERLEDIQAFGYRSVPVVVKGDVHFSGFKPELLRNL